MSYVMEMRRYKAFGTSASTTRDQYVRGWYQKKQIPRHWPLYRDGRKECIIRPGECWDKGICVHWKRNCKDYVHCIYFKSGRRCVFSGDVLPKELFEI